MGRELFEEILIELILTCDEAGLISHEESYYDMTGVEASATQVTPYQRAVILARALSVYLNAVDLRKIQQLLLDNLF